MEFATIHVLPFLNNPKALNLSYNTDLDFWDCFGRKMLSYNQRNIQSTLAISKSKGLSETLQDIRTSTYQMCKIEENTNRTTKFHK